MANLFQRTLERINKMRRYLPWFSLTVGLVSGALMSRDYTRSSRLLVYSAGSVLFLFLLGLVLETELPMDSERLSHRKRFVFRFLEKHRSTIEWFGLVTAQMCAQYILFFSLPLLYFASAWWSFFVTLGFCAVSSWDPWWNRAALWPIFRKAIRVWTSLLAVSFLYAVFLSKILFAFYFCICLVAAAATLPVRLKGQTRWNVVFEGLSAVACLLFIYFQVVSPAERRFPLISVWLRKANIGFRIEDRKLGEPLAGSVSRSRLAEGLAGDGSVCCVTPIVGPQGLDATVVHEWRVNGIIVDSIVLPHVTGNSNVENGFRTYSCKSNLGDLQKIESLTCVAYIGPHIFVGKVEKSVNAF